MAMVCNQLSAVIYEYILPWRLKETNMWSQVDALDHRTGQNVADIQNLI